MILGIDTSLGTSVGIVDADGRVRADVASSDPRGHAEVIGDLLLQAFADAGVGPDAITHVAAGMGPGPFTGLRVGIAAARAFALGRGIPVIAVPSHDAAALAVVGTDADDIDAAAFAVVTDARRREEAFSVYLRGRSGRPVRYDGPSLKPAGDDVAIEEVDLRAEGIDAPPQRIDVTVISGSSIARVAADRLACGRADLDPHAEPLYLRAPDVTMPGARKRVGTDGGRG